MKFKKIQEKDGLFRSIFIAYFILLLHVFLLAAIGVTVVLFKGVYNYLPWIMAGLGILILTIALIFYKRMKNSTSDIKSVLAMPEFKDRTVEIKIMGGLASFKINAARNTQVQIEHQPHSENLLIGNDIHHIEQKIIKLTALFEKDLISKEEFDRTKQNILQG
ncbi:MAG: SHOCT domain-containing protein [Desulfobacula sp.]|nr:SHOCT domain-containing protein [Desulfobacula sp.]